MIIYAVPEFHQAFCISYIMRMTAQGYTVPPSSPKVHAQPESQCVIQFGNEVFVDVTKLR